MKTAVALLALSVGAASGALAETPGADPKLQDMARRVIANSVRVKPGDVVAISGGTHTIPLMEALAIEAQKAGGQTQIFLNSDRVIRAGYTEVPEQHIGQSPAHFAEWLKQIDVWIGLPTVSDPKSTFAGIQAERLAKSNKASRVITDMLNASKVRAVFIGYPTRELATLNQVDFPTYEKLHWDAVSTDPAGMASRGNTLKAALAAAKTVRVTSPAGTDFTFTVGNRPIIVDDGTLGDDKIRAAMIVARSAALPGGTVAVAPIETSARGKVVVPRMRCRNEPLTGVSFEFVDGKAQNFKAEKGADCYASVQAPYTGPKDVFGFFQIGINPARRVMEDPGDFRPSDAAGMVLISIGDNKLSGGNNTAPGGFSFPIVRATVTVDGKPIVQDGRLVP
jgi:aminopeptidase